MYNFSPGLRNIVNDRELFTQYTTIYDAASEPGRIQIEHSAHNTEARNDNGTVRSLNINHEGSTASRRHLSSSQPNYGAIDAASMTGHDLDTPMYSGDEIRETSSPGSDATSLESEDSFPVQILPDEALERGSESPLFVTTGRSSISPEVDMIDQAENPPSTETPRTVAPNYRLESTPPPSEVSESAAEESSFAVTTHFLRSFNTLTSKYGDGTQCNLKSVDIINVIKVGDTFVRRDSVSFISSYLEAFKDGVWNGQAIHAPPLEGLATTERLLKTFQCAELLDRHSAIDPVRLRIVRILLYWHYEQLYLELCDDPQVSKLYSSGTKTASVCIDKILETVYQCRRNQPDSKTWQRRRTSLQNHKLIGKKWSTLIDKLGTGILLICSSKLAMNMYAYLRDGIH